MRKKGTKMLAALLVMAMSVSMIGCGKKNENGGSNGNNSGITNEKYPEFITVDVFASEANYEGIQTGWFAQIVKEKFNMELNIIAPNVSGGGDTLFTTRSAAGNLGDLVIIGSENGRLQDTVTAGLLLDITDKVENSEVLSQYSEAIDKVKGLVSDGKVYAMPKQVSSQSATEPSETTDIAFGAFLRWDYYQEIGAPELNTLEDLIPVLKQIQELHPKTESGQPAYGFSLFGDWDGNMMNLAQQPARLYGYNEAGFVLHKVDGSDYQDILDKDGQYVRGLKLFFTANQEGILDPESTTQNWDTLWSKYVDGAVYFSPWSWQGPSAFNTEANVAAGKGVKYVPIADTQIISTGASPAGTTTIIGVGSKAKDPDRMFDFIEWLYSPEGILANCSPDSGAAGPEGLTWEVVDGKSQLTEFGKKVFSDPTTEVPSEFGGGNWRDGSSALNFKAVLETDINPNTGESYSYNIWDSYLETNTNPLDTSWSEFYNANSMVDLVLSQGNYIVEAGTSYIAPEESSDITAIRNQCKAKIVDYSWKMCFAKDEATFYSYLDELKEVVDGLGYQQVLEYDMQGAKDKDASRPTAE